MSKFFHGGAASESETESESSEDDIQVQSRPAPVKPLFSASESEEEEKRVVRAAKDKRFDELKELIKQLRNSKKIKDMCKILSVFEDLTKAFLKAKPLIDKEGGFTPRFYLRCMVELEEFVNENWEDRDARKNMSKNNARGLTTLRQKLKKYVRDFETETAEYREHPDPEGYSTEEEEEESEEEEERDEPEIKKEVPKEAAKKRVKAIDDSEGEDESDWEESSSEESELEDLAGKKLEELRLFFLKTGPKEEKKQDKKKKDERQKRRDDREKPSQRREAGEDEGEWQQAPGAGGTTLERPKMFEKDSEITPEAVIKKLNELIAARGKKGTDRRLLVENLKELYTISETHNFGPAVAAKVLYGVIAGIFDYNPKISDCMVFTSWQSALGYIRDLLQLLKANPTMYCSEFVADEGENILDTTMPIKLRVCVLSVFERLDDEFTKILQDADCHSTDYVDKLKGEKDVCDLISDIQDYLEKGMAETEEICRIYMRRIEHLYYKFEKASMIEEEINGESNDKSSPNSRDMMEMLCQFIYTKDATKRLRTRAMLCHIYHHALHGRWHEARDLILMSHLQGAIDHSDIATQILYNRTVCQLGLCAFRHGYIRDAHSALSDIQNSGKAKELLAQGVILRGQDRTPEQEKIERQRQIPYHMHINLELLECVYLICAMLLEIPQMASKEFEVRRRMISRSFHYQLRQSERQSLVGPPENTREHVVAASRALLNGDWQACRDFIVNEKMNAKVWNLFHHNEKVKSMIVRRIQEECLRTYLFTYSSIYDSISLKNLGLMFELEQKSVHAIISKMIIQEELSASLDEPAECVVMHRVEPTRLQTLALQLTEKLNHLAENVEQIMDPRSGGQGFAYRQNWGNRGQQGDHQKQDGEHGGGGGGRGRRQDYGKRQQRGDYQQRGGDRDQRGDRGDRGQRGDRGDRGGHRGDRGGHRGDREHRNY